ncbi:MAG: pyrroline-5-carboxylate reductase [Planctomycetes bacterium]|jgi:pyrroline-5-carboxylate reductase|nr:pyrroline-5-carboxylate reductase [Planctomycetota bacterium]MDP6408453.1 pyrroline-5-carboxylate reductase [Planctomycetota bacterium]
MLEGRKLALIGVGTMGRTLARGLITSKAADAEQLCGTVAHAERAAERSKEVGIAVGADNAAAARACDVIVLCVKPKGAAAALAELAAAGALDHDPLLVSIAAGVGTAALEIAAARKLRVVRAMPNTPCQIGQGMTVLSGGRHATADDLAVAETIVRPLGRVLRLDEEHMDAVTGLSASGPAFIYVIIEALAEGGVMVGLPRAVATELAAQTVQGAARMVIETGRHPAALKDDVTTPAGCTISALLALEDGKLRSVLARGVQEAARSAAGLGGGGGCS